MINQNVSSMKEMCSFLQSIELKQYLEHGRHSRIQVFIERMSMQNSFYITDTLQRVRVCFESHKIAYQELLQLILRKIYIKPMDF